MHQSGTRELFIYSPYWLINKTGLHVEYRVSYLNTTRNIATSKELRHSLQVKHVWPVIKNEMTQ